MNMSLQERYLPISPLCDNADLEILMCRFRDVTFRYSEKGHDVLKGVSISVEAGTSVAIVGHRYECGLTWWAMLGIGMGWPGRLVANVHRERHLEILCGGQEGIKNCA